MVAMFQALDFLYDPSYLLPASFMREPLSENRRRFSYPLY
jgi:hypothetical protein